MGNLKNLLYREHEKYVSLVVQMRQGNTRCVEVDAVTGQKVDVTSHKLETCEETIRSLERIVEKFDACDYLSSSRPMKDWHFS
ncbi:hypothetical protein SAMN05216228_101584 [Rhizobium tibeticum]|uniref:Uncharacterized protein n=1 Tax=Rhizobium tibeticum TaxID=501024 RepID=A0A1H8NU62_9HYPH|nr:hypothetical protein RTCCBAU85039_3624 [Rhizobium tibeticum]SEO33190.1 hypothetical protein SAMN05216228_101584 [Rhizobium tibeticum]